MIHWSLFFKPFITVALISSFISALPYSVAQTQAESVLGPATQAHLNEASQAQHRILVVGDSLSAEYGIRRHSGWVELMRQRIASTFPKQSIQVINASISGDTSSGGLTRLPALLDKVKPTMLIIELGANDALRGLAMSMTRQNLTKMVQLAQNAGASVVLTGMQIPPNYGAAYAESFRNVFPEVAQSTNAALVPFLLAGLETDRSLFIEDGIHPSEQAQPRLLDNVWPTIEALLKP